MPATRIGDIAAELTLDDLVANRTMSAEIATLLRSTVRARRSFLVMAVPRLAGKSTVKRAMLAERPPHMPVRTLGEDGDDVEALLASAQGGYFDIPEISQYAVAPGYVWGGTVRRAFAGIRDTTAIAAALHAPDPDDAFDIICRGCRVPDADAAKISLVVYLRSIGPWQTPQRRVVETIHEIGGVHAGRPTARLLFRWNETRDEFVKA